MASGGQTLILANDQVRRRAHQLIEIAPDRAVVNIRAANRSSDRTAHSLCSTVLAW